MISALYKNRMFYYNLCKDFLDKKIKALSFKKTFIFQRSDDLNEDKKSGYSDYYWTIQYTKAEESFREEYFWKLYEYTPDEDVTGILNKYVEGARKYNIKGSLFFCGIYDDLSVNVRDFYPKHRVGFDPKYDIDENQLRKKVAEKIRILDENKDLWEF